VDAQCNKLTTVVGGTKLTTLVTIYVSWRKKTENSAKFRVWDKVSKGGILISEYIQISLQNSVR